MGECIMTYVVKQQSYSHGRASLGHTVATFGSYADARAWVADKPDSIRQYFTIKSYAH
jgi:hypothetical protein